MRCSSDPRFANHRNRIQHVDELEVEIEKCTTKHPSAHWLKLFAENDVAHAPVNKIAEVCFEAFKYFFMLFFFDLLSNCLLLNETLETWPVQAYCNVAL